MNSRYGNGDWQSRKERLMQAYYDLEDNPLWKDLLEDCALRAGDYESSSGSAATDREASKMQGVAIGLRMLVSRALEIREARMAHFASEELKEEYEFGENINAKGARGQAGDPSSTRPRKIERRSLFADIPVAPPVSRGSHEPRDDDSGA